MIDPTLDDMRKLLIETCPDADEFDREAAIYWFACEWHGGQWTNLYAALSASEYSPGLSERICPEESDECYQTLVEQYCDPPVDD